MSKAIVCLGYRLNSDSSIHPILENRLKDSVVEIGKNPDSILMLMGGFSYREENPVKISEAEIMRKYLQDNFSDNLKGMKIEIEENSKSTVEQLCYLRENISNISNLVIVSSEFFGNRVRLYAEYIFGSVEGIVFVDSKIPDDIRDKFREVEADKFEKAVEWLKNHKKGDFKQILLEQQAFQNKVNSGETSHPIS